MKVSDNLVQIRKVVLTELKNLDPITVFLEDLGPGRGRITIMCFSKVWMSFWPAMGEDCGIADFFMSCNNHYLAKNLMPRDRMTELDIDQVWSDARARILRLRHEDELSKEFARNLWNSIEDLEYIDDERVFYENSGVESLMCELYEDDWYLNLPTRDSYDLQYLYRIIDAIKLGLS